MTATTIKVPAELRDRLKRGAASHGRTLAAHLEALLAAEERRERFRRLREELSARPPDERYREGLEGWQGDGWS